MVKLCIAQNGIKIYMKKALTYCAIGDIIKTWLESITYTIERLNGGINMTLHETAKSLYNLSVGGFFNREKFSFSQFENYVKTLFKGTPKLENRVVIEIALPDGWWLCEVIRYSDCADGYNYEIPETREQEQRIYKALTA